MTIYDLVERAVIYFNCNMLDGEGDPMSVEAAWFRAVGLIATDEIALQVVTSIIDDPGLNASLTWQEAGSDTFHGLVRSCLIINADSFIALVEQQIPDLEEKLQRRLDSAKAA